MSRLDSFLEAHPGLTMELVARDRLGDLVADSFDVAIRSGRQEPSNLVARKLFEVRVITCAAPKYLERCGRPRVPTDLVEQRHECLLFTNPATGLPYTWDFVRGKRRLSALPVTGRLQINDAYSYREACLVGLGVAQFLHLGIQPHLDAGGLVELFPDWPDEYFPFWAHYPPRQFVSSKLQALLDFLRTLVVEEKAIR